MKDKTILFIEKEDYDLLHEMATKADKNKSYKEGYLDSYNRIKMFLKEATITKKGNFQESKDF